MTEEVTNFRPRKEDEISDKGTSMRYSHYSKVYRSHDETKQGYDNNGKRKGTLEFCR